MPTIASQPRGAAGVPTAQLAAAHGWSDITSGASISARGRSNGAPGVRAPYSTTCGSVILGDAFGPSSTTVNGDITSSTAVWIVAFDALMPRTTAPLELSTVVGFGFFVFLLLVLFLVC